MTGAKRQILDMFTQEQYDAAQKDLISRLQTILFLLIVQVYPVPATMRVTIASNKFKKKNHPLSD